MLRSAANFSSYVLHPVFLPILAAAYLYKAYPLEFVLLQGKMLHIGIVVLVVLTVVFPLLSMIILRQLGLIKSLKMADKKERVIPLIAVISFYLWTYKMFAPSPEALPITSDLMAKMLLGTTFGLFVAFFANAFFKISLHTTGAGSLLGLVLITATGADSSPGLYIGIAALIAGIVGTSRLLLQAHSQEEVYYGYIAGFFGMSVSFMFF